MAAPALPDLFHLGWVVRDCRAAQERLGRDLGAGPWLPLRNPASFEHVLVHGAPTPVRLQICFGRLGNTILELLEPLDDRSPHAEFLAERGEGLHHVAFLVSDFDQRLEAARAAEPPMDLLIDGTGPGNGVRWAYLEGDAAPGAVVELIERTPASEANFAPVLDLLGR